MSQSYEYFGKYILLEKLATGGMAEVWLARAPGAGGIGKFVAIKKILPQYSDSPEFLQMFKDEATIAMNLSHGNIVSIYELGQEKNQLFLVMDFVEGRNLRQILNKMKGSPSKFSVDQIVYVIKEVAAGLDHAHRSLNSATGKPLNIIHRDMSPQNVMISFEGEVKIVDFGIAKAESQLESTRTGTLKGKFGYMSPEQAEGQETDLRTDIFSVGIVLWELLANDRLFIANNEINTLRKIKECNVPTLSKLNPNVQPELERITMKALTRDRNLRYQTAAAMHRDLNRFLNRQYPDFSPHDFSVFIKTLYTDEIIDLRSRQVEYAKIPFRTSTARGGEDKTLVTSFPQMPNLIGQKSIHAGTGVSIQTIRTAKAAATGSDQDLTETETFTDTDEEVNGAFNTATKPPLPEAVSEKLQPELPLGENGAPLLSANVLNSNKLAESLEQQPQVLPGIVSTPSALIKPLLPKKKRSPRSRSRRTPSAASWNIMIFLAGTIVTYVLVTTVFATQLSQMQSHMRDFASWFNPAPPAPTPQPKINSFNLPIANTPSTPQKPLPPATTGLTVNSAPSGAEIFVNNVDSGQTTPGIVRVPADGTFSIGLKLDRYIDYNKPYLTILRTGPTFTATLQPAAIGYLDIDVRPPISSKIYINGRQLRDNILPISDYAIPAGAPVTIRAVDPIHGKTAQLTVRLQENEHRSVILYLKDRRYPASHSW